MLSQWHKFGLLVTVMFFASCVKTWGKFWDVGSLTQVELTYAGSPFTVTQNVAMTAVTPSNGSDFDSCTVSPALPAGLTLNAATCALSGTPTQGGLQKSYAVSASGKLRQGTGTFLLRSYFQPKFAYSANSGSGNITRFLILANGQLSPQGNVTSATQTWYCLPSPDHKFLFVANKSGAQITVYSINGSTGALNPVSGSPYTTLAAPHSLSLNPSGTVLYVGHDNAGVTGVTAFAVNTATGALTSLNGGLVYPVASGFQGASVAVPPDGKHLYIGASLGASNPYGLTIDQTSGALSPLANSPFSSVSNAIAVAVHPSGDFVYFAQYNVPANGVMAFSRNSTTGALQNLGGLYGTGTAPTHLVASTNGLFLYVSPSSANVYGFKIDTATGSLTATPSSPYGTAGTVQGVAVDETGKYVYSANSGSNNVNGFQINASTGDLSTPTPGGPYAAGTAPVHIVVVGGNP